MHCYSHPTQFSSASLELCWKRPTAQPQQPPAMGRVSQAASYLVQSGHRASARPIARAQQRGRADTSHGARGRGQAASEHLPRARSDLAHSHKPAMRRQRNRKEEEATDTRPRVPHAVPGGGLEELRQRAGRVGHTDPSGLSQERKPRAVPAVHGVLNSDNSTERTLRLESDRFFLPETMRNTAIQTLQGNAMEMAIMAKNSRSSYSPTLLNRTQRTRARHTIATGSTHRFSFNHSTYLFSSRYPTANLAGPKTNIITP